MKKLFLKLLQMFKNLFEVYEPIKREHIYCPPLFSTYTRKSPDYSEFTQYHWVYICHMYRRQKTFNGNKPRKARLMNKDLVRLLNEQFGMHKSQSSYSQLWSNRVPYDSLPAGQPLNIPLVDL